MSIKFFVSSVPIHHYIMEGLMKYFIACLVCLFICSSQAMSKADVTPKDILTGKYAADFFPKQFEYTLNIEKYKQVLIRKKHIDKQIDSLFSLETLSLWPVEEQKKYKHILELTRNNKSGDVYIYIKELGAEYASSLNKVVSITEIYTLERNLIKINQQITGLEEWAANLAAIVGYYSERFKINTFEEDMYLYVYVLGIDKEIQELQQLQTKDGAAFMLKNEEKARNLYTKWKPVRVKKWIKSSPQRDYLFLQLEQRFKSI